MYHRIAEPVRGIPAPTFSVSPTRFRQQLTGLLERGYRAMALSQLLELHHNKAMVPPKRFVVTFDDGYENILTQALPVLEELQIPATLFTATAYIGAADPFPFDDWQHAGTRRMRTDTWRPLGRKQMERLLKTDLIEVGSHTHTHADFRGQPEMLQADLQQSAACLQEWFGIEHPLFAFPYGSRHLGYCGGELSAAARDAGMRCAMTTEPERITATCDPFDWGRFAVEAYDTPASLEAKLAGWYYPPVAMMRKLKQRLTGGPAA